MKKSPNPMQKALEALKTAPKCRAYARTTGEPCKNASMTNGRCRMHGGKSNGTKPKHVQSYKAAREKRRAARELIRDLRSLCNKTQFLVSK